MSSIFRAYKCVYAPNVIRLYIIQVLQDYTLYIIQVPYSFVSQFGSMNLCYFHGTIDKPETSTLMAIKK